MQLRTQLFAIGFLALALSLRAGGQAAAESANTGKPITEAAPQAQTQTAPAAAQTTAPQAVPPQTPAQQMPEEASAPLRVMVGKSILINTTVRLKRVSVTDPAVADALVVTPTQILVHGRAPGEVSLIVWDEQERSRSFDLRVDVDVRAAAQKISVTPSRAAIVLSGHVATKEDAERAGLVAGAFSKNVVNVLSFGPVG